MEIKDLYMKAVSEIVELKKEIEELEEENLRLKEKLIDLNNLKNKVDYIFEILKDCDIE